MFHIWRVPCAQETASWECIVFQSLRHSLCCGLLLVSPRADCEIDGRMDRTMTMVSIDINCQGQAAASSKQQQTASSSQQQLAARGQQTAANSKPQPAAACSLQQQRAASNKQQTANSKQQTAKMHGIFLAVGRCCSPTCGHIFAHTDDVATGKCKTNRGLAQTTPTGSRLVRVDPDRKKRVGGPCHAYGHSLLVGSLLGKHVACSYRCRLRSALITSSIFS